MKITKTNNSGFTIVELLIVIVVIGILAAITIVAYNGIQNRANDTAIQSDLSSISKKLEIYRITIGDGLYPTKADADLAKVGISVSRPSYTIGRGNLYYCPSVSSDSYAIGAVSKSGSEYFLVNGKVAAADTAVWASSTCGKVGNSTVSAHNPGYAPNAWSVWVN